MAHINLKFFSEALDMQASVEVIIPQKSTDGEIGISSKAQEGKYKCLYLLHGLSDDETIWMRRTSIERYAAEYGICVVMPCAARSFYSDMSNGGLKYYTYIAKEIPAVIEEMLNVSPKREDRYIGGLSMGGYGALKIAMREEGRYAAAFGLSSVADIYNETFTEILIPVFNGNIPKEDNLFELAAEHNADALKPRIYMTVGRDDYMYNDNVRLSKCFKDLDYDYEFVETQGTHSWALWDNTVQDALKWMLK